MLAKEFYHNVISNENKAVTFLREHNLVDGIQKADPCYKCGAVMQEKRKRDRGGEFRPILRCPRRGCQTSRSIRTGNKFFHYTDLNGKTNSKLSICEILELVYYFVSDIPISTTQVLTGKSPNTVTKWFNMCRKICGAVVSRCTRNQMVGTQKKPIHIDKIRFAGRRYSKNSRIRLLIGDQNLTVNRRMLTSGEHSTVNNRMSTSEEQLVDQPSEDSNGKVGTSKDPKESMDGPWVFGLKNEWDCRYFYVQRKDKETLVPIIKRECQKGSVIYSDERWAYLCLKDIGYKHEQVDHIEPTLEGPSKTREHSWFANKIDLLMKRRGILSHLFQPYLDYYCWRALRNNNNLFIAFLNDIRMIYRT